MTGQVRAPPLTENGLNSTTYGTMNSTRQTQSPSTTVWPLQTRSEATEFLLWLWEKTKPPFILRLATRLLRTSITTSNLLTVLPHMLTWPIRKSVCNKEVLPLTRLQPLQTPASIATPWPSKCPFKSPMTKRPLRLTQTLESFCSNWLPSATRLTSASSFSLTYKSFHWFRRLATTLLSLLRRTLTPSTQTMVLKPSL